MRYFGLWSYYYNHIEQNPRVCMNGSGVRFLIFHEDNIFLSRTEGFHDYPDGDKFDTPTEISLSHSNSISIEDAANHFQI